MSDTSDLNSAETYARGDRVLDRITRRHETSHGTIVHTIPKRRKAWVLWEVWERDDPDAPYLIDMVCDWDELRHDGAGAND